MRKQNVIILSSGVILIFLSLYIFTRPAIFDIWDFSDTGQIGDTIGGITAPIINIIGAFLVYISFQAQITANRIQFKALEDEKKSNKLNDAFNKHLSVLEEIKSKLRDLEFIVIIKGQYNWQGAQPQPVHITYRGVDALNEFVLRLE